MKIAISSVGPDLESSLDLRFGRARQFVIFDKTTNKCSFIENTPSLSSAQGAGIQTAQLLIENDVDVVISGHCGPKAHKVLMVAGIKVFLSKEMKVKEALNAFNTGLLVEAGEADVEGHW